ncbi:MAG: ribonuclease HI family protein, partial [Patescibacteria group bacterium]|nr:ribonuclease HI family protein [Patescibacteria group bacterium]
MYTDGGSRGNPGPAAIGIVINYPNKKREIIGKYIGVTTNNVAEYTAVLEGLRYLKTKPYRNEIHIFLDSELVQRQLSGIYKVKHPILRPLFDCIQQE